MEKEKLENLVEKFVSELKDMDKIRDENFDYSVDSLYINSQLKDVNYLQINSNKGVLVGRLEEKRLQIPNDKNEGNMGVWSEIYLAYVEDDKLCKPEWYSLDDKNNMNMKLTQEKVTLEKFKEIVDQDYFKDMKLKLEKENGSVKIYLNKPASNKTGAIMYENTLV